MLYLFLAGITMVPATYCWFDFVNLVVPMSHRNLYTWGSTVVLTALWYIFAFWFPGISILPGFLMYFLAVCAVAFFAPPGRRCQAVLVHSMIVTAQLFAATIACFLPLFFPILPALTGKTDPSYPFYSLLCTIVSCPAMYGVAKLLRRVLPTIQEHKSLIILMLFPFSHILVVVFCILSVSYGTSVSDLRLTVVVMAFICIAECIAIMLGYRYIHRMELSQLHAKEAEKQLQIQVNYYQELQKSILEINQVRHDLSNQLQAAYSMMEKGEHTQVSRQLDQIQEQIRHKIGTRYCTNMVVDAVLTSKSKYCEAHGIPLQLSVFLPSDLAVETAHLCSIFSNLLDNSISATLKTSAPYAPIELYADLHGEYLTIRCSNASAKPPTANSKNPLRKHGLGLQILSQIADLYNGNFQTSFQDGTFTASMFLQIPNP